MLGKAAKMIKAISSYWGDWSTQLALMPSVCQQSPGTAHPPKIWVNQLPYANHVVPTLVPSNKTALKTFWPLLSIALTSYDLSACNLTRTTNTSSISWLYTSQIRKCGQRILASADAYHHCNRNAADLVFLRSNKTTRERLSQQAVHQGTRQMLVLSLITWASHISFYFWLGEWKGTVPLERQVTSHCEESRLALGMTGQQWGCFYGISTLWKAAQFHRRKGKWVHIKTEHREQKRLES